MKRNDERILKQAGKLERKLGSPSRPAAPASAQQQGMDFMKTDAVMNQQLNMRYLAIQEKMQRGVDSLISNLMKARNDAVKEAISGGG